MFDERTEINGGDVMERHTMTLHNLPCPLCGCKCATEFKDMDYYYNGKERYWITTRCVCGISFESAYSFEITEDRAERLKVRADALIDHLKKWNNRTVYKDMMDICAYAENIKTRTQKYSKIKEGQ